MRRAAAILILLGLLVPVATSSASSTSTYALGKAKHCRVNFVKRTLRHTVTVEVMVGGRLKRERKSERYVACVYVAPPKPVPPPTTTTTTTTAPAPPPDTTTTTTTPPPPPPPPGPLTTSTSFGTPTVTKGTLGCVAGGISAQTTWTIAFSTTTIDQNGNPVPNDVTYATTLSTALPHGTVVADTYAIGGQNYVTVTSLVCTLPPTTPTGFTVNIAAAWGPVTGYLASSATLSLSF